MLKFRVEPDLATKLGLEPGEYEVHNVAKGVAVLSFTGPLGEEGVFSEEELSLLRKLSAIRFEKRIPFTVNKSLSEKERKILDGLIKDGYIELYKEGKYSKTGVYNISREVFPLLYSSGPVESKTGTQLTKIQAPVPRPPQQASQAQVKGAQQPQVGAKLSSLDSLKKFGFAIVDNEFDARNLSATLDKQIRAGDYLGMRAFNKKFYIAEKGFYVSLSERIRRILVKRDASAEQLAQELKVPEDACTVALRLMNHDSEVIEKKKGMYGLV